MLNDISTSFAAKEVVSVIGPSGGGKSTFLRCLNLLETPTAGQILVDGADICDKRGVDVDKLRQKMGMVFQQFNLFENMNVLRNLTVSRADAEILEVPRGQKRMKRRRQLLKPASGFTASSSPAPVSFAAGRSSVLRLCAR